MFANCRRMAFVMVLIYPGYGKSMPAVARLATSLPRAGVTPGSGAGGGVWVFDVVGTFTFGGVLGGTRCTAFGGTISLGCVGGVAAAGVGAADGSAAGAAIKFRRIMGGPGGGSDGRSMTNAATAPPCRRTDNSS